MESKGKFVGEVFLVGAGASAPPPSSLPTAMRLTEDCLDLVLEDLDQARRGAFEPAVRLVKKRRLELLTRTRFEVFFSLLNRHVDRGLAYLQARLGAPHPNRYHFFLARALREGAAVLTTNFDKLIEAAYWILYREEIETTPGREGRDRLLCKLHGSLGGDLAATMEKVVRSAYFFSRNDSQYKTLRNTLKSNRLVVFGYSGSDELDIMPLLDDCGAREIVWINHETGDNAASRANIEERIRRQLASASLKFWHGDTATYLSALFDHWNETTVADVGRPPCQEAPRLPPSSPGGKYHFLLDLLWHAGMGVELPEALRASFALLTQTEKEKAGVLLCKYYLSTRQPLKLLLFYRGVFSQQAPDSSDRQRALHYAASALYSLEAPQLANEIWEQLESLQLEANLHAELTSVKGLTLNQNSESDLQSRKESLAALYRTGAYQTLLILLVNSASIATPRTGRTQLKQMAELQSFGTLLASAVRLDHLAELSMAHQLSLAILLKDDAQIRSLFEGLVLRLPKSPHLLWSLAPAVSSLGASKHESHLLRRCCRAFAPLLGRKQRFGEFGRNLALVLEYQILLLKNSSLSKEEVAEQLSTLDAQREDDNRLLLETRLLLEESSSDKATSQSSPAKLSDRLQQDRDLSSTIRRLISCIQDGSKEEVALAGDRLLADSQEISAEIHDLLEEAESLKLESKFSQAIHILEGVPPDFPERWEELADNYCSLERIKESDRYAKAALARRPDSYIAHYVLGFNAIQAENFALAKRHLLRSHRFTPGFNAEVFRCLLVSLYFGGYHSELLEALESVDGLDMSSQLEIAEAVERMMIHAKILQRKDLHQHLTVAFNRFFNDFPELLPVSDTYFQEIFMKKNGHM